MSDYADEEFPDHMPCRVKLLDTLTGVTAVDDGHTPHEYASGNWSCDCNRGIPFGHGAINSWACVGGRRYLVISCSVEFYSFREMNYEYPTALLKEFESYWELEIANQEIAR